MRCYYIGQFEANVDDEPFITWACFHPESKTTVEIPVDCPVEFGNPPPVILQVEHEFGVLEDWKGRVLTQGFEIEE